MHNKEKHSKFNKKDFEQINTVFNNLKHTGKISLYNFPNIKSICDPKRSGQINVDKNYQILAKEV